MEKTEKKAEVQKIIPIVKSPSRDRHLRKGKGFSLGEIKKAGLHILTVKKLNIEIDYFRKSTYDENIEKLKKLKIQEKKGKKREKFVPKEKKIRVREKKVKKKPKPVKKAKPVPEKKKVPTKKPAKAKVAPAKKEPTKAPIKTKEPEIPKEKVKIPEKVEATPKVEKEVKTKTPKTIKEKTPTEKIPKEKIKEKKEGTPLTELSGLGGATEKKFAEIGVSTVEEFIKENPEELGMLISGVSVDRIKKWKEEAKELISK
ncbi:MAG: helix-hairpin-helix domain-containing protein [Candidatus Hermodarchaeota archaeon]